MPQGLASWHLMLNLALCGSGRGTFSCGPGGAAHEQVLPQESWFSEQRNRGAGLAGAWPGRQEGGGEGEQRSLTRGEIRDPDPERWRPSGVCAGFSMITGTGSELGRSFHIRSGLFDRDRLFRYWLDRVAFLLTSLCPGSGPYLQPQAQCLRRWLGGQDARPQAL